MATLGMVKGEKMMMNQGDGEKKEDRKKSKRRNAERALLPRRQRTLKQDGRHENIEDCKESRDEKVRLAQILTVSKGVGKKV